MTMLTLTTGCVFIMWLGEQITERGVGNGMSLLIFAGIVVGLPRGIYDLCRRLKTNAWGAFYRSGGHHADRGDGHDRGLHRLCRAQRAPYPCAVCQAGCRTQSHGWSIDSPSVAGKLGRCYAGHLRFVDPDTAADRWLSCGNKHSWGVLRWLGCGEPLYTFLYGVGIIFFAYFYVSIVFNPDEVADNMRKYGGFIPGIRPGRELRTISMRF